MSFYTVKQIAMRHPAFTESSLRNLIAKSDKNGFDKCVFRPPGVQKVLIDETRFEAWIRD
jgi:hypothetical protein